jgi:hypothetical protein
MIVHDRDIVDMTFLPPKANPPLLVDANTVLATPLTLERFQSIAWGHPQVFERLGVVQHAELSPSDLLDRPGQLLGALTPPDPLGFLCSEALDHDL